MTEQEQKVFIAMREALEKSRSAITYSQRIDAYECVVLALTAANTVSHAKPETTPAPEGGAITSESAANAVQPQAQGEQRYLSIDRVSGFPDKLDAGPQPVLYSDSINGCMVRRDDVWLALTSHLNPQAIEPAGWKLVPVEPTQEMLDAVVTTVDDHLLGPDAEKQYREDWVAMLAAAPEAP